MIYLRWLFALALVAACTSCSDGVIVFPTPESAFVRIINTSRNLAPSRITIDSSTIIDTERGLFSTYTPAAAGRPIQFDIGSTTKDYRTGLRYTLGGGARIILFVRGDTSSTVEFRREIQDTVLPSNASESVIRFTHMAEFTDKAYFVEVWTSAGTKLFPEEYEPGISSRFYARIAPGTYSFELREAGTTTVVATLQNVVVVPGRSYMLYSYDSKPPIPDQVALQLAY